MPRGVLYEAQVGRAGRDQISPGGDVASLGGILLERHRHEVKIIPKVAYRAALRRDAQRGDIRRQDGEQLNVGVSVNEMGACLSGKITSVVELSPNEFTEDIGGEIRKRIGEIWRGSLRRTRSRPSPSLSCSASV